ncbi:hypothetical protein GCM10007079_38730 [Nocardiopsis terrae]|nr:hypothetical protein GCM10007079_38730 [Nocardiopsis terrae]
MACCSSFSSWKQQRGARAPKGSCPDAIVAENGNRGGTGRGLLPLSPVPPWGTVTAGRARGGANRVDPAD